MTWDQARSFALMEARVSKRKRYIYGFLTFDPDSGEVCWRYGVYLSRPDTEHWKTLGLRSRA